MKVVSRTTAHLSDLTILEPSKREKVRKLLVQFLNTMIMKTEELDEKIYYNLIATLLLHALLTDKPESEKEGEPSVHKLVELLKKNKFEVFLKIVKEKLPLVCKTEL